MSYSTTKNNLIITNNFKIKIAKLISKIAYAPILSVPAFFFINWFFLGLNDFIIIETVSLIFSTLLPTLSVLAWSNYKRTDADLSNKEDRTYPLLVVILSYFIGATVLYTLNAPSLATILMFCYFLNTLIVFFINFSWKISIHAMGVAGPTTILTFAFGYIGSLLGLLLPLVMWSRISLKKHNMLQVLIGASLGFVLTIIETTFLLKYYGIYVNIFPVIWIVLGLMLPPITLAVAGYLNDYGAQDGYTRKIFHFVAFSSLALFMKFAPVGATIILIITGALSVAVTCLAGMNFSWFRGIKRRSDYPNETLYVVLPLICTIFWLFSGWKFFNTSILIIGTMCVAIGDAIAEPIGVKFGNHKYKVQSLTGNPSQRSIEGSFSVFFTCSLIIFLFTKSFILAVSVSVLLAFVEAISPRGTDNFTLPIAAAIALSIIL